MARTGCQTGPGPGDAEALAESIRSDPDLVATAPVAVTAGGDKGLMMDVKIPAGATCATQRARTSGVLNPLVDQNAGIGLGRHGRATGHATGERMRLYLFDAPEGSSMRILAIAIIAPESASRGP